VKTKGCVTHTHTHTHIHTPTHSLTHCMSTRQMIPTDRSSQTSFTKSACGCWRHIYIYIHIHIHACIHTYIHTYTHAYIQTGIHSYIHTYIHTCIHTDVHALAFLHTCHDIPLQNAGVVCQEYQTTLAQSSMIGRKQPET
jgi:hypothetical protein